MLMVNGKYMARDQRRERQKKKEKVTEGK